MADRIDRTWLLGVAALTLGVVSPASAAVRWQLRGDVASGQQFAAVADAAHVHIVSEHYVRLDAAGTVVVDEADVADEHQGGLDFYPAIATGPDGSIHVVTRHGGDFDAGYEIRYRRREAAGGWGPEIVVGSPVARNYVVGVTVTPSGRVLVAHSRLVENVYSVMPLYEIAGDTATMIGETPSGWLRADNDFRLAASGSAILLASGEPGPSSPIHVSFAADGDGDVLGQWEASHVEHEGGIARRGGPATHVDDTGAIHFVYGGESTLHYARYDGSGALVAGDATAMTDLGMWHLSHGLGAVVATPDGMRVLVVGLQNTDGDQGADGADLLYVESQDAGASFGAAVALGATTDGGEGRMRMRLERVGDSVMLLYYDPTTEAIALATAAWVDDPPPGGSTDDGGDSTGGVADESGDAGGGSTGGVDPSTGSTTAEMTTAELPPGQSRGYDSGCGCRGGDDARAPWLVGLVLLARRRRRPSSWRNLAPDMTGSSSISDGRAGARSRELFAAAQRTIPGGVNSPVRAYKSVGGNPPFVRRAEGAYLWTEDDAQLIDYVGTWGPAILGHAHPEVIEAVARAARDGLSFGAPTAGEVELAERICEMVPSLRGGMVRLCNSGTEATMSALRVARGFTGRDKIVKTDGAYHGHADTLLVAAGSGAATLGLPGSAGVPKNVVADTLLVPWNDIDAIAALIDREGPQIAAVIIEPVVGNMGCVPPRPGYLERLRELTAAAGIVLVFDEVMTGFRVARGGAQERYGITPDMTTLGKIVGGGMPVGAYGGRRDIMQTVAPLGPVYQAGTLSGNPVAVAAGLATLKLIDRDPPYALLERRSAALCDGLAARARAHGLPWSGTRVGSMFTGFFQAGEVWNYDDAKRSDTALFAAYFREMLARGVYLAPSQFEAGFLSVAHDDDVIARTLAAADDAMAAVAAAR